MPTMFVHCKQCGTEFPSGIAVAEGDEGKVLMFDVLHACPECKSESRYFTPDYYIPSELRSVDRTDGSRGKTARPRGASRLRTSRRGDERPGRYSVVARIGLAPTPLGV